MQGNSVMTYFLDTNIISYILNGNTNVKKRIEELILQDNDILMSHINSRTYLGRSVQYHKRENEVIIHGMNLLRIQTKADILDCSYAYYFFQNPYFKKCVDNRRTDAVNQSSINIANICDIKVDLPSLPIQQKVASVLSALDKKIALNRQINQNLPAHSSVMATTHHAA